MDRIKETPGKNTTVQQADTSEVLDFDYVVSEAAVGKIHGVPFTVAGFETKVISGVEVVSTYLDIDKKEFVDVENGTEFMLNKDTKVKVVKLIPAVAPDTKGKIYFKVLSER